MDQKLDQNSLARANPAPPAVSFAENKREIALGLAGRLREAFNGATNAEIARRLDTPDATLKFWMDGDRLPSIEMLLRINRVTGVNLHWLIKGEGSNRVGKAAAMFSKEEETSIRAMAARSGRTIEEQIRVLVVAGIEFVGKV